MHHSLGNVERFCFIQFLPAASWEQIPLGKGDFEGGKNVWRVDEDYGDPWGRNKWVSKWWFLDLVSHKRCVGVVKYFLVIICIWVFCLHVCLCTTCMFGACGGQKVSEILDLELQFVVRSQVGAGILNPVSTQEHTVVFLASKPSFSFLKDFLNFILK